MGCKLLTLFSFHLLHLLFFHGTKADSNNIVTDVLCKVVNCGFGTCTAPVNITLLPFDCECSPGWKKLQIGPVTLPPCILPNCTLDLNCGGSAPPPPPPILLPNLTNPDPCSYTMCGDGTCVRTDQASGYKCQCNEGSDNLLSLPGLLCLKKCSFGADCGNFRLGPLSPPPPPNLSQAPTSKNGGGAKGIGHFARDQPVLAALLLLATLIPWI